MSDVLGGLLMLLFGYFVGRGIGSLIAILVWRREH